MMKLNNINKVSSKVYWVIIVTDTWSLLPHVVSSGNETKWIGIINIVHYK